MTHANGGSFEIDAPLTFDLHTEKGWARYVEARDTLLAHATAWEENQAPKEEPPKVAGTQAYFSGAVDRTYDVDNGPFNYAPVIKSEASQISLRANDEVT